MGALTEISLFTGGGGGVWGSKLLGHRIVCYVEIEPYCQEIIRQRIVDGCFDDAPVWDDVRSFDGKPWRGKVDIVSGGFPCQPFSVAGKQKGESDERNMWPDTVRVISEVRPRFALLENVPGLLGPAHFACDGRTWLVPYFLRIAGDLSEIGYDCRWTIVSAADVGAPHRRKRLWILAYPKLPECEARNPDDSGSGTPGDGVDGIGQAQDEGREGLAQHGAGGSGEIRNTASEGLPDGRGSQMGRNGAIEEPERPDCITWWDIDPADLPDTKCINDDGSRHGAGEVCGERSEQTDISGSEKDISDTERTGLEGSISERDSRGERLPAEQNISSDGIGQSQSFVGRAFDGLSAIRHLLESHEYGRV